VNIQGKQELRKLILDRIKVQKEDVALLKSRVIVEKVMALPVFKSAGTILFYASSRGEVDTFALMQRAMELKKRVALPLVRKEERHIIAVLIKSLTELKAGSYGIQEPLDVPQNYLSADELDLVIVPGVAFDRQNNRLGRGAGYYDRFLSKLPARVPTIALAYDLQVVDAISGIEAHDRPVTQVITN
jgi:5-formyltetrahydrofolate cyclo-ligase